MPLQEAQVSLRQLRWQLRGGKAQETETDWDEPFPLTARGTEFQLRVEVDDRGGSIHRGSSLGALDAVPQ